MRIQRVTLSIFLFCCAIGLASAKSAPLLNPTPEHSVSTLLITQLIERLHYTQPQIDDARSQAVLEEYIDSLDPNRMFFTSRDITSFNRHKSNLDNALLKGDLQPAFTIFHRFNQRRIERAEYAVALLEKDFDFTVDETYRIDRSETPWPESEKELDEIWRKRVKNDVLNLKLSNKADDEIKKTLRKRYERLKTRSEQFKPEDIYELFINAFLRNIEPHTAYFSPRNSENFKINLSLSLEGIGAVLQTIDEHTVVQRVVPGGPADLGGQLHSQDRIIGVAQGAEGKMEDVVGWRLDDVVELIRGPKDSTVRLQILPKASGLDGPSRTITIVRNKIKLEEQQAQQSIIEVEKNGKTQRIGVIDIPTFYMDFDGYARGDKDFRSTTRDTRALLEELKAENVDGIVIDLRGNGGGSLPEAISLTGLFIKSGPVVQIKDSSGELKSNDDEDKSIAYRGPLAVLVDRYSASASEIFAGAIQDYGRGTIIGEPTFGKGTVQTIIDLNRYVRQPHETLGQLKLTMAQFFRVNGDSTQHRGVVPDIIFPTAEHNDDEGERSLDHALPWAQIASANYTPFNHPTVDLSTIFKKHKQRVEKDEGFKYLLSTARERREQLDKQTVSLLKQKRKLEREKLEKDQHERLNEFRVSRGLEPVTLKEEKTDDETEEMTERDEKLNEELNNIELREAANILVDIIKAEESAQRRITLKTSAGNHVTH